MTARNITLRIVDAPQIVALLLMLADQRPDYIHRPDAGAGCCLYLDGDRPGCIIGHVLHHLGATIEFLRTQEGMWADHVAAAVAHIEFTAAAVDALMIAQGRQDEGATWSAAAVAADIDGQVYSF
jgi:hypothetical protein